MKKLEHMNESELRDLLNTIGKNIVATATNLGCEKPLFCLLLFNDPKLAQYICNCKRDTMVAALREAANRLERSEDVER